MKPFNSATETSQKTKTMHISMENGSVRHFVEKDWLKVFKKNDVVVVNDAATIPASFLGHHQRTGQAVELRLVASLNQKFFGVY